VAEALGQVDGWRVTERSAPEMPPYHAWAVVELPDGTAFILQIDRLRAQEILRLPHVCELRCLRCSARMDGDQYFTKPCGLRHAWGCAVG
jgi:hypothetical protein